MSISETKPESRISALLRDRIEAGDFPSAVYVVAERSRGVFADALGDATREPEKRPATLKTIYDLASLTKPLVTGLLCARQMEHGGLNIDDRVADYLPEFHREDKRNITIKHLLAHTSGLPAWLPIYLQAKDKGEAMAAIAERPLAYVPGERVVYSDLGFIALGFLLQRVSGRSLPELAQDEIFVPLELGHTFFNPSAAMRTGVAACETGNAYERDMCERDFAGQTYAGWRSKIIWGEVHDGNAHFLGGAAGHAGLFSNAADTLRIANQFIAELSQLLSAETCQLFRQNFTEGLNENRSFAWQLAATKDSTAGGSLSPDAFGHTGFTGTSCWIDAARQRVFILLTNRTHARQHPFANINAVRREFHTLANQALNDHG
ncbi:MAG TPA: serine hydrolase domain-containing protein [Pyrinomonadaceae bacterium]|nr:serine hydrolase domain-containing protein [Pyrinomonadaceae bacterium]